MVTYEPVVPNPKLKLLDQVREVMRLNHYSIRTERAYCDWVRRYMRFHQMSSLEAMLPPRDALLAFAPVRQAGMRRVPPLANAPSGQTAAR
jgi:Phage integrase, N-terminal SAM-like domain